jgi:STE24 endopeptidase
MYNTVFFIIISILVFDFLFGLLMNYLNSTMRSTKLPVELEGIYDAEKYAKQQEYEKVNSKFSLLSSSVSFVLILLMFVLGGFAFVDEIAHGITENSILIALIFFGILMLASDLIGTPFDIYDTFVIEEKFGFNKTTPKTYFFDKIKGWLLGAIIGGGLMALIIWLYDMTKDMFWIYAWLAVSVFSIFMAMFYSNLIVPLFNKQTPLPEGELRTAIENFSLKAGFNLQNIFQIDGSKRSTKANAYFTGLGSKKRIVLYDTLIKDMTINEIVAVLAHEIGHYKHKHSLQGIFISLIQTGIVLFIFSLFVDNQYLSQAMGVQQPSFHIGMIAFGILFSPISTITSLFMNILSRKNEYQADKFAAENFDSKELASALKKLSVTNLSNLTPHPFNVFVSYSHPPLLARLKALKSYEL